MHRPQYFVWHRGGAGDGEKFTTCTNDHFQSLLVFSAMVPWRSAKSKRV
jgi:hypothetical protein